SAVPPPITASISRPDEPDTACSRTACASALVILVPRAHLHAAESGRRGAVRHVGDLPGLSLAAVDDGPRPPCVRAADEVARIPELRGDPLIGGVLQHANPLPALHFPCDLGLELKVVSKLVDRPGTVRLHVDAVIRVPEEVV